MIKSILEISEKYSSDGNPIVIVTSPIIRKDLSILLRQHIEDVVVLAFTELPESKRVKVIATVGEKITTEEKEKNNETQTFKAKDVKSAINLVNTEFGDKAIILSTKNNGFVEVEASDNDEIIIDHQKKLRKEKFFKCFFEGIKVKKLKNKINDDQNKVSYLNKEDPLNKNQKTSNDSKEIFEKIRDEITSLRKEINGMIVTDQSGISDELSHQTQ